MYQEHEIVWDDVKVARLWGYFGKNASLKDQYFTNLVGGNVLKYLTKYVKIKNKEVLDYGSGPGHLLGHIVKMNLPIRYSALDNSKESIERLNKLYSSSSQFKKSYYVESFPTNIQDKFDLIISCEVIEHLEDHHLQSMINEFKNMLNPGGVVMITTPNNENLDALKVICPECGCIYHRVQHVRSWNVQSMTKYMEGHGFTTVKVEALNLLQKNLLHRSKQLVLKILSTFGYEYYPQNLVYIGRRN